MEKEQEKKVPQYTKSNLKRYVYSEDGTRYQQFLNENNYQLEDFEKKTIQEQATELKLFFDSKGWKLKANRQAKFPENIVLKGDDKSIIEKITDSIKCDNDKKIDLIKKALLLKTKEEELTKLQQEIDEITTEINAVI